MFRIIILLYLIFLVQTSNAEDFSIKDEQATSNAYQSSAAVID